MYYDPICASFGPVRSSSLADLQVPIDHKLLREVSLCRELGMRHHVVLFRVFLKKGDTEYGRPELRSSVGRVNSKES